MSVIISISCRMLLFFAFSWMRIIVFTKNGLHCWSHTSHPLCHISHLLCHSHMVYLICHMSHLLCPMSYLLCHLITSYVICHIFYVACHRRWSPSNATDRCHLISHFHLKHYLEILLVILALSNLQSVLFMKINLNVKKQHP